jgi:hypothetical protein
VAVIEFLSRSIIGIGATLLLDLWGLLLNRIFGLPMANWELVGRWFGHLPTVASSMTISRRRGLASV